MEAIFKRYTPTLFETQLEDNEFIFHNSKSTRYPLKDNEIIFENTLNKIHIDDTDTMLYLKSLKKFLIRNIDKNVHISLKFIHWTNKTVLVVFKFVFKR